MARVWSEAITHATGCPGGHCKQTEQQVWTEGATDSPQRLISRVSGYNNWLIRGQESKVSHAWLCGRYPGWSILDEAPEEMDGRAVTPVTMNLFTVWEEAEKLKDEHAKTYHHLTAKLLYLCKWAHPDLQTTISFLTTQVTGPDEDDWKKLARCIWYLWDSKDLHLTLAGDRRWHHCQMVDQCIICSPPWHEKSHGRDHVTWKGIFILSHSKTVHRHEELDWGWACGSQWWYASGSMDQELSHHPRIWSKRQPGIPG